MSTTIDIDAIQRIAGILRGAGLPRSTRPPLWGVRSMRDWSWSRGFLVVQGWDGLIRVRWIWGHRHPAAHNEYALGLELCRIADALNAAGVACGVEGGAVVVRGPVGGPTP